MSEFFKFKNMKVTIKHIIIFLIQLIEYYEFRNIDKDENKPNKKIVDIIPINKYVKTDYGNTPVSEIVRTIPLQRYELLLENDDKIECADTHIIYCKNHTPKLVLDLTENDEVITISGLSKIKHFKKLRGKLSMFDLTIDGPEPSYYTNNILSHNTVSAAIVILHFVLFNNDKGCMVVANKGTTVIEIIDKIKSIYKHLPFFLKRGVINWNQKSITFDNGCRIKSENRTKEPAIGFTIDLLYFDEFAKVPSNIIRPYYGSAVPTVSSIKNSKIIITSTPDGYNLFYELLTGAEKAEGDKDKNTYESMRVYWWQVKGRRDTKLYFNKKMLSKYGVKEREILQELELYGYTITKRKEGEKLVHIIAFDEDNEKTHLEKIRSIRLFDKLPLVEICNVTNWQEEETKLVGGESIFKQEYDIQFITGDKLLFDSITLERIQNATEKFEHIPIPNFDKRLALPYDKLEFIKDRPDLFEIEEVKKYHMMFSIDLAEGLGSDYTVLNIFRLLPKDKVIIEKNKQKFTNIYDYFKLEQVGFFHCNYYSVKEFAHLLYMIAYEMFDPEKCKISLEYNTYGGELLAHLPNVFEGDNDYFDATFIRTKHNQNDKYRKKGLKITKGNKVKLVIKDYQDAIKKHSIIVHNALNILEMKVFSKRETPSGDFTYQSETGNDDTVMSLVNLSASLTSVQFKDIVDDYIATVLNDEDRRMIETNVSEFSDETVDYSSAISSYKKVYLDKSKKPGVGNSFKSSPFEQPNPYQKKGNPFENNPFGKGTTGVSPFGK